jgi:hypothetical protein
MVTLQKDARRSNIVLHQKWQEKYLIWANIHARTIMTFENLQMHPKLRVNDPNNIHDVKVEAL